MTAMTGYEFYCWLEGVLDMNPDGLTADQIARIREKMQSVKSPQQFAAEDNAQPQSQTTTITASEKPDALRPRC
jgi:hypothetical protein